MVLRGLASFIVSIEVVHSSQRLADGEIVLLGDVAELGAIKDLFTEEFDYIPNIGSTKSLSGVAATPLAVVWSPSVGSRKA